MCFKVVWRKVVLEEDLVRTLTLGNNKVQGDL